MLQENPQITFQDLVAPVVGSEERHDSGGLLLVTKDLCEIHVIQFLTRGPSRQTQWLISLRFLMKSSLMALGLIWALDFGIAGPR